jgi:Kef-type K+ transport system membrane component KefB
MNRLTRRTMAAVIVSIAGILVMPISVAAYAGPGSVVTGFGALLALVAAVLAAFFGFLWYPIKRAARWLHGLRPRDLQPAVDPEPVDGG